MSETMNELDSALLNQYVAQGGVYAREALPLLSGLWDDNGTLKALAISTTGTLGFKYISDGTTAAGVMGLEWAAAADNTDTWVKEWMVPQTYRRDTGRTGEHSALILRMKVRKLDTTGSAAENATLQLKCDVAFHSSTEDQRSGAETDGDALITAKTALIFKTMADQFAGTLSTASYIPAKAGVASFGAFRWMECDIGAGLAAAQLASIKAGATITVRVYPSAAVGTALALQALCAEMVFTGHVQPANISIRTYAHRNGPTA